MEFFSVGAHARGFIAIGAEAEGVIALGQVSRGFIAIGQMATGVIAVGQLARGVFVIGQLGVGVWSYGQLGVAIVRGVGMLGVGARAGGMIPLALWPTKKEGWKPGVNATIAEIAGGALERGWVDGVFSMNDGEVTLSVRGERQTDCEISEEIATAVRTLGKRRGWVLIERQEVLGLADEGGFREAPSRTVRLAASNVSWQSEISTARLALGVVGMLLVSALVVGVALVPVAQSLISLAG